MRSLRSAAVLMVLVMLAVGCGGVGAEEATIGPTLPPASTTAPTTASTTSAPPTTQSQPIASSTSSLATTTPSTTLPPTTSLAPATTTTAPSVPWPEPGFPEALPPEAIPWDEVGAGWLLVDYAPPSAVQSGVDPNTTRALFLVDADDTWYGVLTWPGPGVQVLDWSPDGRRILALKYATLVITDLREGTTTPVPVDSAGDYRIDRARFTRPTGRDIVVLLVDDWNRMRVRLETLHSDGTRFALLVDRSLTSSDAPEYVFGGITWLYAASGTQVVATTSDGIDLLTNQGNLLRTLNTPGLGCTLSRWWDDSSVLAACWDRQWAASPCWGTEGEPHGGRSLWVVPTDGSPATPVTPAPTCTASGAGNPGSAPEYFDALAVGGVVAATRNRHIACSGGLDLIAGHTITPWLQYPGSTETWWACDPELITARGNRLLIWDWVFTERPKHEQGFGVIFDIAADGTALQVITPAERGCYGGVLQVFTSEETAFTIGQW